MDILLPEIRSAMRYSKKDFAQVLGVSSSSVDATWTTSDLRLDQLTRLASTLDCSVETFAKGFFDLDVVRQQFSTAPKAVLPTRYQKAAFSKTRTSASLFQFVEFNIGKPYAERLLKALQVHPSLLQEHENAVSMQLVIDVANLMRQWGANAQLLERMGSFSAYTNRGGPIGEFFKECRNTLEVYDKMIPALGRFFEHNHDYRILTLNPREVIFEAKTSEKIRDSLSLFQWGSVSTCDVRKGVAGSFALYIGIEPRAVLHPRCMHRGDESCVYHVIFGDKPIGTA